MLDLISQTFRIEGRQAIEHAPWVIHAVVDDALVAVTEMTVRRSNHPDQYWRIVGVREEQLTHYQPA